MQQSNIETLNEVGKMATDGFQAIAKRQAEMVRDAFEGSTKVAQEVAAEKPADRFDASAKYAKTAFDTAVSNFQELTDLTIQSQTQAFEKFNAAYLKTVDGLQTVKPASK